MSYLAEIEPRLTPCRPAAPATTADVLVEWCRDLEEELAARLARVTPDDLAWQPHPDANSAGVTVWHVARWIDVLGTRSFTGRSATDDVWHTAGWRDRTGYEPDGLGFLGLGTLTGYSPEEMRAVPAMEASALGEYLSQSVAELVDRIRLLGDGLVATGGTGPLSPYQIIGATLQGSFGHVGELDALIGLRVRSSGGP